MINEHKMKMNWCVNWLSSIQLSIFFFSFVGQENPILDGYFIYFNSKKKTNFINQTLCVTKEAKMWTVLCCVHCCWWLQAASQLMKMIIFIFKREKKENKSQEVKII